MKIKLLNYLNLFFIISFFPSFVTGVFLPNLVCGLFIVINLLFNFKKLYKIFLKLLKLSYFFLFFYSILIISSIFSDHYNNSLESSALYFLFLIYFFSLIILFKDNQNSRKLFFFCGVITCFVLSIDGFYEFFNGVNVLGYSSIDGRLAGLFDERWVLGRYLIYILPILVGIYFLEFDNLKKYKIFIFSTFFLSGLIIIFSGERAAFIMFFIYLFLLFLFLIKKLSLKYSFLILTLILLLISLPFLFTETSERIKDNFLFYLTSTDFNTNQYLSMFTTSWKMFIQNPFFGVGPNNFRLVCSDAMYYVSKWSCSTHPHSITFQALAEIGMFGFIAIFSVLGYFVYKSILLVLSKEFSNKSFGMFSLQSSIIIYLFPFMITGNFFLSWYGFIYYLPISLFIVYSDKVEKNY